MEIIDEKWFNDVNCWVDFINLLLKYFSLIGMSDLSIHIFLLFLCIYSLLSLLLTWHKKNFMGKYLDCTESWASGACVIGGVKLSMIIPSSLLSSSQCWKFSKMLETITSVGLSKLDGFRRVGDTFGALLGGNAGRIPVSWAMMSSSMSNKSRSTLLSTADHSVLLSAVVAVLVLLDEWAGSNVTVLGGKELNVTAVELSPLT